MKSFIKIKATDKQEAVKIVYVKNECWKKLLFSVNSDILFEYFFVFKLLFEWVTEAAAVPNFWKNLFL